MGILGFADIWTLDNIAQASIISRNGAVLVSISLKKDRLTTHLVKDWFEPGTSLNTGFALRNIDRERGCHLHRPIS